MAFDVPRMAAYATKRLQELARTHSAETFYAFAIDATLLCANSEEAAGRTLLRYQHAWEQSVRLIRSMADMTAVDITLEKFSLRMAEQFQGLDPKNENACLTIINKNRVARREKGCKYKTSEGMLELRNSTGDWEYQGFAEFNKHCGFDHDLYDLHYSLAMESATGHAPHTEYALAMTDLIAMLVAQNAFSCLRTTRAFRAIWVDHDY